MSMRPVIQDAIVVMDDGAYDVVFARRGLSDADFNGATVIRANSSAGCLIRAIVWLGGPYTSMREDE